MNPVVTTTAGRVEGRRTGDVDAFLGVPFAAPPVGPLRYALPQPPAPWDGVRPCVTFGANCPQGTSRPTADTRYPLPEPQDEDCLVLNVWTPATDDGRDDTVQRPVFVYVHSGGYFLGTPDSAYLEGSTFARDDVVFVSVHYRLNGLGFLHLDELFDGLRGTGNLGLHDVVRALEWVQENIAAFGGDPGRVTLGGHSAGGLTTCALLAAPRAKGLFHRAVPISSASGQSTIDATTATAVARRVLAEVGIRPGDLDALRAAPARQLVVPNHIVPELYDIAGGHPLDPVADGDLLAGRVIDVLREGAGSEVDLLIGVMAEEHRVIVFDERGELRDEPVSMGVSAAGLDWAGLLPERPRAEVEAVYRRSLERAGREVTDADVFAAAATDLVMHVPSTDAADAHSGHGGRTWAYRFAWSPPGRTGAQHGTDIPFFMDRPDTPEWRHLFHGRAPAALARAYHDAVVAMAAHGDPGHAGLPAWPRYDPERRATMIFDESCTVLEDPEGERRALFAGSRGYRG